ncbi:hypothetical protein ACQ5SO_17265 [Rhodovulum sp. DZ06]|uniref:hypothetical protein n=1 Tax=Rhodovulum sp. DZ06 TaxID=3425126 RepID=UPI003D33D04F
MPLWPHAPGWEVVEALEWATSVQEAESDAQRIAARALPFRTLSAAFRFALPGSALPLPSLAEAEALLREIGAGPVDLPLWPESVAVGDLAAGAVSAAFDTAHGSWQVGERAALRARRDRAVSASPPISAVRPDGLDFAAPLTEAIPDAIAAPVRAGRLASAAEGAATPGVVDLNIGFQVVGGPLVPAPAAATLDGLDIFDGPVLAARQSPLAFDRPARVTAGPAGPVVAEALRDWHEARGEILTLDAGAAARWARRGWLHARRGRQVAFWAPSLRPGLTLAAPLSAGAAAVTLPTPPEPDQLVGRGIRLSEGGAVVHRRLGAWAPAGAGVVAYAIAAPGAAFTAAAAVSELRIHRLDTDRVELLHRGLDLTELACAIVERPA